MGERDPCSKGDEGILGNEREMRGMQEGLWGKEIHAVRVMRVYREM